MIWKKKFYIPLFIIIITIILSVYYEFFKDNEIEDKIEKSKYIFNERIRNIDIDKFPIKLPIEFEKFLKDMKNIYLLKEWTSELAFNLTQPPYFDLKYIYLVSYDKIAVYDKNAFDYVWLKQFDNDIQSFSLIDGNIVLIVDADNNATALNRNSGELVWEKRFDDKFIYEVGYSTKPIQISNINNKKLNKSIIIIPLENKILILDSANGEDNFEIIFEDTIGFVSEYDQIEDSIYVLYGQKISKLVLKIN
jgi:hypothetical protein